MALNTEIKELPGLGQLGWYLSIKLQSVMLVPLHEATFYNVRTCPPYCTCNVGTCPPYCTL